MSLRLTNASAVFFAHIDPSAVRGVRFLDIDKYYACLMLGLKSGKLGSEKDFRDPFLAAGAKYPDVYSDVRDYIAGLLVEAEIRRRNLNSTDRDLIESETVKLLDPQSPLGLSDTGIELLNRYAAGGFEQLRDHMGAPYSLEVFLVKYAEIWNKIESQ